MNRPKSRPLPVFLLALAASACDASGSACIVGGSCEQLLINRCTCCDGFQANECRQDRQERCAANELRVPYTPAECTTLNSEWATTVDGGGNPCEAFTPGELQQICENFDRRGRTPDRREGPPPQTEDERQ